MSLKNIPDKDLWQKWQKHIAEAKRIMQELDRRQQEPIKLNKEQSQ